MRMRLITMSLGMSLALSQVVLAAAPANISLKTQQDKVSYSLGNDFGSNLKHQGIQIEPQVFAQGLEDAMSGTQSKMTKKEMQQTLLNLQKQMQAKRVAQYKELSAKNEKAGTAFLAENKSKPGVKTMADGLQYKVVTAGNGATPTAKDIVTVNYEGKKLDGTVFDSSYKRGKPATFAVGQVVKGWQEALTHMKTGATWEVYIPAKLAYGPQGVPGVIGPNETLVFKINLLSIKSKKS